MPLELLFLGTGTSAGVPMIGCRCAVCTSTDPRDARSRPSVLVSYEDASERSSAQGTAKDGDTPPLASSPPPRRRFLIDTAPEMRVQMIRHQIDHIDGVLYTHAHADHILGIDDLRRINAMTHTHVDIYADERTLGVLRSMFRYIFEPHNNVNQSFIPTLAEHPIAAAEPINLHGATWTPLRLMHGRLPVLGFRVDYRTTIAGDASGGDSGGTSGGVIESLAYCTDVSVIAPETFPLLENLDVLVIDGLRYREHPTHLTVEQALEAIRRIKPRRAYLTHIAHDIMHAELEPRLPENVSIAFDGLVVRCGDGARE